MTLDSTLNQQNNSFLYFRPQLGPNDSSGSQFFSLQPAIGADPSIRINQHASDGTILATGYLVDTSINPSISANPTFSTVTIVGNGIQPTAVLDISCSSAAFQLININNTLKTAIIRNDATAFGGNITFEKSRAGLQSQAGDELGYLSFDGTNTAGTISRGAFIMGKQDGAASATGVPGRIEFHTSSATVPDNECMRIDSSGNVGIGTTSPYVRLQTAVFNKTALDGIAAVSDDVNTIIGAYAAGPYTGLNVGSVQATSGNQTFNNYDLALNPRGGDVYMGDGSITCRVWGNLDVSGTGTIRATGATPYLYLEGSAGQGRVYDTVYNIPTNANIILTSGTTYILPTGSYSITYTLIGGGGGAGCGGDTTPSMNGSGAGGGGGGEVKTGTFLAVGGDVINYSIGSAGTGAPSGGANGISGTSSILTIPWIGTVITSAGGTFGGGGNSNAFGGNGGNGGYGGGGGGSGGTPGSGGTGTTVNGANGIGLVGGNGGYGGAGGSNGSYGGGGGGGGIGAGAGGNGTSGAGTSATGFGGGGGGGASGGFPGLGTSPGGPGGNGAPGVLILVLTKTS